MFYALTIKYNKNDKLLNYEFYNKEVNEIVTKGNFTLHKTAYEFDKRERLHVHCVLEHKNNNVLYKPFFKKGFMIFLKKIYSDQWISYIRKDITYHENMFIK